MSIKKIIESSGDKMDDFDKVKRDLDRLSRNAKELDGTHEVPITDLLTKSFMNKHSRFVTFEELIRGSGLVQASETITQEDIKAIPQDKWDTWIAESTDFSGWNALIRSAANEYIERRMFEGL